MNKTCIYFCPEKEEEQGAWQDNAREYIYTIKFRKHKYQNREKKNVVISQMLKK
jgi:hypothetical protein